MIKIVSRKIREMRIFKIVFNLIKSLTGSRISIFCENQIQKILVGFFVLLSISMLNSCVFFSSRPSDDSMIDNFFRNESKFIELINLFSKEKEIYIIAPTFTGLVKGSSLKSDQYNSIMTQVKREQYLKYFRKLNLAGGIKKNESGTYLIFHIDGFGNSGNIKGYAFLSKKPAKNYSKLEPGKNSAPFEANVYEYRSITGNWYLYSLF